MHVTGQDILYGRVTSITPRSASSLITVSLCGSLMTSELPNREVAELGLTVGSRAKARFDASDRAICIFSGRSSRMKSRHVEMHLHD